MQRTWTVWTKVFYCDPARRVAAIHNFRVFGYQEAMDFAELLRAYGDRPLKRPEAGDKDVLIIDNYVIWPGGVESVWIDENPEYLEHARAFTEYDPLLHDDFDD